MARYKPYNLKQDKFIPVAYADQILPGSFEHTLNELVEHHTMPPDEPRGPQPAVEAGSVLPDNLIG